MQKDAFKHYLRTNKFVGNKPYSESVADERVRCCGTIEKTFSVDLDLISDTARRADLLSKVSAMKKSHVKTFVSSLQLYFDFADTSFDVMGYVPMNNGHFYRLADDMPADIYFDMLSILEGEYEHIMGWGRDLLGLYNKCDRIERIPVVLSPAIKKKTYKADENYWSQKIYELSLKKNGDITKEEVLQILKKKSFTDHITGEFCIGYNQFGPHIILYYNVIHGVTIEEKLANFANVLAHEYMHYMEWRYCSAMGVMHYSNENLSEAMADFFAVLYSIKCNNAEPTKVAHTRYETWVKRFGSRWPYAQALHFCTISGNRIDYSDHYTDYETHGSVDKLIAVFDNCYQPDIAYNILKKF